MPYISITLCRTANFDKQELMKEISRIAGEESGKGEKSLMLSISEADFMMRGSIEACAFIDFRGIGKIEKDINAAISRRISAAITGYTAIPAQNIYLNFTDMPRENWGHSEGVY